MVEKDSKKLLKHMLTKEFASDLTRRFKKNSTYRFVDNLKNSTINAKFLLGFARKIKPRPVDPYEERDWSFLEMMDLALDIYKDFDIELYNQLKILINDAYWYKEKSILKKAVKFLRAKGLFQKGRDMVFFAEPLYRSNSGSVKHARNGIMRDINLHPDKSVLGVLTLAHEFAHWLCKRSLANKIKEDSTGEIFSLFMERYGADWLFKHGYASEDDVAKFNIRKMNDIAFSANSILRENYFAKHFENDSLKCGIGGLTLEDVIKAQQKWSKQLDFRLSSNKILNDLMAFTYKDRKPAWHDYRYVYGGAVSTVLYRDFQEQPEETKFAIKQFIKHDDRLNMEDSELILLGALAKDKIKNKFDKYFLSNEKVEIYNDSRMNDEELESFLSNIEFRERYDRLERDVAEMQDQEGQKDVEAQLEIEPNKLERGI